MASEEDKTAVAEFVAGRVQGINIVILSLAETHPDPKALLVSLETLEQYALAQIESSLRSDDYLAGFRNVIDGARTLLHRRLERESDKRNH